MIWLLVGLGTFSAAAVSVCIGLSVLLRRVMSERDACQVYVQQMSPLVRYLSHCYHDGRLITDDGLHSAFAMQRIDYATWIEQVVDP